MDRPAARIVRGASQRAAKAHDPIPMPSLLDSPEPYDDEYEARPRARGTSSRRATMLGSNNNNISDDTRARRRLSVAQPLRVLQPQSSQQDVGQTAPVAKQRRARAGSSSSTGGGLRTKAAGAAAPTIVAARDRGRRHLESSSSSSSTSSMRRNIVPVAGIAQDSMALRPISTNTMDTRHLLTTRGTLKRGSRGSTTLEPTASISPRSSEEPSTLRRGVETTAREESPAHETSGESQSLAQVEAPQDDDGPPVWRPQQQSERVSATAPEETIGTRANYDQSSTGRYEADLSAVATKAPTSSQAAAAAAPSSSSSLPPPSLGPSSQFPSAPEPHMPSPPSESASRSNTGGTVTDSRMLDLVELVASMTSSTKLLKRENTELATKLKDALRDAAKAQAAEARLVQVVAEQKAALLEQSKLIDETFCAAERLQSVMNE